MKRGEIWICDLATPKGAEAGYRRPVVIVESDDVLSTRLRSVIVVPLTTKLSHAGNSTTILLPAKRCKLRRDSVVLTYLVTSIDQAELLEKLGTVPRDLMEEIDFGLQTALGLL